MELEIERKWFLGEIPEVTWEHTVKRIVQIYNPYNLDQSERVREIVSEDGSSTFLHCVKTPDGIGTNIEDEREITKDEYLGKADQYHRAGAHKVVKDRIVFTWGASAENNGWVLELDLFKRPKCVKGLAVLEVELSSIEETPLIPRNFTVIEEVTGNKYFSNRQLSLNPEKTAREAFRVSSRVATRLVKLHGQ